MRRYHKRLCLELLQALEEEQNQLEGLTDARNTETAGAILAQCQQDAIRIGEFIESLEGETSLLISRLEDYCEEAYRLYEKLGQESAGYTHKAQKKLRKSLEQIKNTLQYETGESLEIVFLPYKASMWDSLESVWRAAKEAPDCKAYVVPIPYYDRNPDGSFGERHYEGELYPKDVPVTDYNAYDLESRHPDIIFFHNPYDNKNFVTSVEPRFYSDRLKAHTERLVYIPYFVLSETDPDDSAAVKGMEHFALTPGVLNADTVIVQSEAMRQLYIKVLAGYLGEKTREALKKKVLGLGSPKYDRLAEGKQERDDLPKEWERVILRPDGSRKNVILYNTSVGAFLQDSEKMLKKIENVFGIFRKNAGRAALLWRPHPLLEGTIASMRPRLLEPYRRLVEEYRRAGWGIYDDTPELDRAIAVCDAYYGDSSSLVELCQRAGKPVLIQNTEVQGETEEWTT